MIDLKELTARDAPRKQEQKIVLDKIIFDLKNHLRLSIDVNNDDLKEQVKTYLNELYEHEHNDEIIENKIFYRARIHNFKQNKKYKPSEIGAPPQDKTTAGRLQLQGTPYLYCADSEETAAAEVKPFNQARLTIGKFKTLERLKIKQLNKPFFDEKKVYRMQRFREKIAFSQQLFSKKYHPNDPQQYWDTIFITEIIRSEGFDGICFDSAVKNKGLNYVFFYPSKLKCISTAEYEVTKIEIGIEKIPKNK